MMIGGSLPSAQGAEGRIGGQGPATWTGPITITGRMMSAPGRIAGLEARPRGVRLPSPGRIA